ncbi:MAG: bifunctional phosphoglucose/phosphomannose isomerase [Firmicutes bacterium]|nr:bifunctional phosphoglucose/phosphomannose isomerase [Bacillota bacterium]MDH7495134.1 bifunctional phosphoglucose/phosphomannose isomerase [Bacillota bacterium]
MTSATGKVERDNIDNIDRGIILDDTDEIARLDPGGMLKIVGELPQQIRDALGIAEQADLPSSLAGARCIVAAGLGGSAIGGDVVREIVAGELRVPMVVVRDYGLPAFVDRDTLVFASSYSGNTEETLSAYGIARDRGARVVCITSGGRLAELASRDGMPLVLIPKGFPPRTALAYLFVPMLAALARLGYVKDAAEGLDEAELILGDLSLVLGPQSPVSVNQAKRLAIGMYGKIPLIYGSSGIAAAAALRWKTQINENSKTHAFWNAFPELNHNETVGWGAREDISRGLRVVLLKDKGDHPRVQRREEITATLMAAAAGIDEVHSLGRSKVARLLSLVYVGDFASLYLAFLNGVDPKPVEVIDYLKGELARA